MITRRTFFKSIAGAAAARRRRRHHEPHKEPTPVPNDGVEYGPFTLGDQRQLVQKLTDEELLPELRIRLHSAIPLEVFQAEAKDRNLI